MAHLVNYKYTTVTGQIKSFTVLVMFTWTAAILGCQVGLVGLLWFPNSNWELKNTDFKLNVLIERRIALNVSRAPPPTFCL